ncbi:MAG TPA: hypothetical protein VIY48_03505 [Candidatus Paceibacterota bacterium]
MTIPNVIYYSSNPILGGSAVAVFRFYEQASKLPERYVSGVGWIEDQRLLGLLMMGDLGSADKVSEEDAQKIVGQLDLKMPR